MSNRWTRCQNLRAIEEHYDDYMHRISQPTVVIAVNAFRAGGSQTYAFTLARMLSDHGLRPVLVGKRGPWIRAAKETGRVVTVMWREGTATESIGRTKRVAFVFLEAWSAWRLRRTVRNASLIISSQPGPTAFFSDHSANYWPGVRRYALVHGTTAVEWPFRDHEKTVASLSGLMTATQEAAETLEQNEVSTRVAHIGNLYSAQLFWQDELEEVRRTYRADGPIVFLGTLTPNKTAPLVSLFAAVKRSNRNLVIVGNGPDINRLRHIVQERGLTDLVRFAGRMDDPRPVIAAASVVVTAGRGAIESMSAGRPTIVATSEGTHGLARLHRLDELEAFNFTGRTPTSKEHDDTLMTQEIDSAWELGGAERSAIAERFQRVGSILPILKAVDGE